jgi:hypothetical protein
MQGPALLLMPSEVVVVMVLGIVFSSLGEQWQTESHHKGEKD